MLSKLTVVPTVSQTLVAGLVLGVIPWVVSGYLFRKPTVPDASQMQVASGLNLPANTATDAKATPNLLATDSSAHRLTVGSENAPAAEYAVERSSATEQVPVESQSRVTEKDIPEMGPGFVGSAFDGAAPMTPPATTKNVEDALPVLRFPAIETPAHEEAKVEKKSPPSVEVVLMPPAVIRMPATEAQDTQTENDASLEPRTFPAKQIAAQPVRSEQLESIARQADEKTRHGLELASRGAFFAARSEFIAALRLVAQGLDTDQQATIHSKALAAGLTALREAEDFLPRGSMVEANLDVPALAASHTTPVLKNAVNEQTTALAALKTYLTYAQEQFATAAGQELAGSMALRALGKLHEELANSQRTDLPAATSKAVVYYQAALMVAPQNYLAANDLGVLLARNGKMNDARAILEHAAKSGGQAAVWTNLANVYERLGRNDLANHARQQAQIAQRAEMARRQHASTSRANGSVQWMNSDAFAQTSPNLASPPAVVKQTTPARNDASRPVPAAASTNEFGSNNPHWTPNYPAATFTGQMPSGGYQR